MIDAMTPRFWLPCPRPARRTCAALFGLLAIWGGGEAVVCGAPKSEAPVLLSTQGGPRRRTVAELEKAAAAGEARACYDLALLALEGASGVKKDPPRAVALYEKAGAGGVADAWFRLGKMFHDGVGVERDLARSFQYYLRGARVGVPEAQYNVGAMLVSARGVKRDLVEGLAWLIIAGKSGAPAAAEAEVREGLKRRPADIAAAERRAAELLADPYADKARPKQAAAPAPAAVAPVVKPVVEKPKIEIMAPKVDLPVVPAIP